MKSIIKAVNKENKNKETIKIFEIQCPRIFEGLRHRSVLSQSAMEIYRYLIMLNRRSYRNIFSVQ